MYQPFRIGRVFTNMKEKKLVMQATNDILAETVNNKNIQVFENSSRSPLGLNFKVDGKMLEIIFPDYPIPNTEYIVIISNLLNVADEPLDRIFKRNIMFKSKVTSDVKITSPSDHETLKECNIKWIEENENPNGILENQFYLEVSTDPAFYNKVLTTHIYNDTSYSIGELDKKQYYVRVRAENESGEYGKFSEAITFKANTYDKEAEDLVDIDYSDDDDSVFSEQLSIIKAPDEGSSPKSFIIKFNKNIDPDVEKFIKLYRRRI